MVRCPLCFGRALITCLVIMLRNVLKKLRGKLFTKLINNNSSFENIFIYILNKHASKKRKVIRTNYALYVIKALWEAIMKRSQLKKIYLQKRAQESFQKYKKQKNTAVGYTNES